MRARWRPPGSTKTWMFFFRCVEETGEVGNDDSIDAAFHALLAEGFEAELHDGIEVSHKAVSYTHLMPKLAPTLKLCWALDMVVWYIGVNSSLALPMIL